MRSTIVLSCRRGREVKEGGRLVFLRLPDGFLRALLNREERRQSRIPRKWGADSLKRGKIEG
jgi:hypothetical protein